MALDVYTSTGARLTSPQLPTYVTSLPSGPIDGQEVYYAADATNGVIWHLRYRSDGTTYKWEYVGGPPLYTNIGGMTLAQANSVASGTFTSLGSAAGSAINITVPLIGTYIVTGTGSFYTANGSNSNVDLYMGFKVNGTSPTTSDTGFNSQTTQNYTQINWTYKVTVTSASDRLIEQQIAQAGATRTIYAYARQMTVFPVKVA